LTLRPFVIPSVLVLLGLMLSDGVAAQNATSGGLTGVVTDPSEAVVQDADVGLKDNSKGTQLHAKTDTSGAYLFSFLLPGSYTLTVTHPGFQTATRSLDVLLGPPGTLNVKLEIASPATMIEVTEEAPLLKAENGDVAATLNRLQISELPNPGNDLTYIAQSAPGAIMGTENSISGNVSILGMPATSNLYTINGMNYNDGGVPPSGAVNMLLGQNAVQEATVVSHGYSTQFGMAAGSNINYVTKSGGNEFHGNAKYFWNGRAFNANDWILKAFEQPRPFDNANQWAGSFGGPIKKDKLFFFFNTEGIRILLPNINDVVLPSPQFEVATIANIDSRFGPSSASDAFYKQMFKLYNGTPGDNAAQPGNFDPNDPTGCTGFVGPSGLGTTVPCAVHFVSTISHPTDESLVSGRVDWNVGNNDRVFVLVQYDHGYQATHLDPISPLFNVGSNQPWWQGQLVETHSFGPSATNQAILAGWWLSALFGLSNPSKTLAAFPTTLCFCTTGTFANLGGMDNTVPSGSNITMYQLSDDFEKVWGRKKLGFGGSFVRELLSQSPPFNVIGNLQPQTLDAFYQGGFDPKTPSIDFTQLNQAFPATKSERFAGYHLALYGNVEWHARPDLTLTLGLRAEHESNPICKQSCFAKLNGTFESISHDPNVPYNQLISTNLKHGFSNLDPIVWMLRFSFAWQPFGVTHNTVLRGGFGVFYDTVPGFLATFSLSRNPPLVNSYSVFNDNLSPGETTNLFQDAGASNSAFVDGFAAGKNFAQIAASFPPGQIFSPPALTVQQNKIHWPQYQKWSLEVQQAFGANTTLTIGYYGNHGLHEVVQNISANAFSTPSFDFGPLSAKGLCTSPPVPPCADPAFGQVTELTFVGVSNYNGLVASFQHRFTRWGQGIFQANYTYGHALDEVSNGSVYQFSFSSSVFPQDPHNIRGSYGNADYDVRHSFNANYVWEVPVKSVLHGHGSDYLVKGWQISGTVFARGGYPYTAFDFGIGGALAQQNFFGPVYAVPAGPITTSGSCGTGAAIPAAPNPCLPPQVLPDGKTPNPEAVFLQTGCETGFNAGNLPGPSGPCGGASVSFVQGRNRFHGPRYFNTDFAIMKNTKIPHWESANLGIGFQFFNFFNHPNFQTPDNGINDPTFGLLVATAAPPTSILGSGLGGDVSPRMIQLKVQLQF